MSCPAIKLFLGQPLKGAFLAEISAFKNTFRLLMQKKLYESF